jgi:hypothetical protein
MFMRFRGSGVGHVHLRPIDQQLNRDGWGSSWPSFEGRDPEPDPEPVESRQMQASAQGGQNNSHNATDFSDDLDGPELNDEELAKLIDAEGEDQEQPLSDAEDYDGTIEEDDIDSDPMAYINFNEAEAT